MDLPPPPPPSLLRELPTHAGELARRLATVLQHQTLASGCLETTLTGPGGASYTLSVGLQPAPPMRPAAPLSPEQADYWRTKEAREAEDAP